MSRKPLVVVGGATGTQGGSIANTLLATGHYRIRGLTRKPESDKAKALADKGAEIVKCDLSVKEDVENALKGADIAWIVTNFLDPSIFPNNVGEEERQGKLIADVAKETGLNWLIYSSLPDTTVESGGKLSRVTQFDGKNHVEQYIKTLGIPNSTFVYLSYYLQNFDHHMHPNENGEVELHFPYLEENDTLFVIDAKNDTGPIIAKIIEEGPAKWNGKRVPVAAECITLKHVIDTMTKVTGKTHKLKTLNDDVAKESPLLAFEEVKQMFKWFKEYDYFGKDDELKDLSIIKKLHPNVKTYEQYVLEVHGKK